MGFCYLCGKPLVVEMIDAYEREVCPTCEWVHYQQLKVSAAALVESDRNLLLVKRGFDPWKGCWYLPAGYVEANEDPANAAVRELFEETGLIAQPGEVRGVYFFDDDPRGNGILIVYRCQVTGGQLKLNLESVEANYFSSNNLPGPLTGAGHERAIKDWLGNSLGEHESK
jgi:8-oxo-dGTP diphosphatase